MGITLTAVAIWLLGAPLYLLGVWIAHRLNPRGTDTAKLVMFTPLWGVVVVVLVAFAAMKGIYWIATGLPRVAHH